MSGLPYIPDNRPSYHGDGEPEVQASYLPYPRLPQSEFGGGPNAAGHGKEEPDVEAWSVESLEGRLSRKLLSKSGLMGKVVDKGNIYTL